MSEFAYEIFQGVAKLSQQKLLKVSHRFLLKEYGEDKVVMHNDRYVCATGTIPILLVAHLDTVHPHPPADIFYDKKQEVIWSPQGIGADDRAGVCMIYDIVKQGLRPHIVFVTDEEIGGIGTSVFCADNPTSPWKDLRYVIELDRRGANDCVFYDSDNVHFEHYVEAYGFKTVWGTFSDISILCPHWGIAGVNLSVGYYNEHTPAEFLRVNEYIATLKKVATMLSQANDSQVFTHNSINWHQVDDCFSGVCSFCCDNTRVQPLQHVWDEVNEYSWYVCKECSDTIPECQNCNGCGSLYVLKDPKSGLCIECKQDREEFYGDHCVIETEPCHDDWTSTGGYAV